MLNKYVKSGTFLEAPAKGNSSWGWKSVVRGRVIIKDHAIWRIGDGKDVKFWTDRWIESVGGNLGDQMEIPEDIASTKVSNFILHDNSWDFVKLQEILPGDMVDAIRTIPLPLDGEVKDAISWPKGEAGMFTT